MIDKQGETDRQTETDRERETDKEIEKLHKYIFPKDTE